MSMGGGIGAALGGAVGFFIGGPMGALYGAGLGFGAGLMFDPMMADTSGMGNPDTEAAVMESTVGGPCPDVLGTGKIIGHLLCYGNERSTDVTQSYGGKGGDGSQETVIGYQYYMTWAVGICSGPIAALLAVYKNEDTIVWDGDGVALLLPTSGGQETIVLDGMGSCTFYFGTADQVPNELVGAIISDDTLNTPYRNYCWAVMEDCIIGNYPRCPTMSFIIKKIPEVDLVGQETIQDYDYNSISAIYYILNTLAGLPTSWLNLTDFEEAARIIRNEFRGISVVLEDQQSALAYIETINSHINAILRYGSDGQFHPKLIRDDYEVDDLPIIDESILLDDPAITRKGWIETVNEIKIQYSEIIDVERPQVIAGSLWVAGSNGYYKTINSGGSTSWYSMTELPDMIGEKVTKVIARNNCSFLFKEDGTVWAKGANTYGQLGIGNKENYEPWTQVPGDWVDFDCDGLFSMGIDALGSLYCTGSIASVMPFAETSSDTFIRENKEVDWILAACTTSSILGVTSIQTFPNLWYPTTSDPTYSASNFVANGQATSYVLGFPGKGGYSPSPVPNGTLEGWTALNRSSSGIVEIQGATSTTMIAVGTLDSFVLFGVGLNNQGTLGLGNYTTYIQDWTEIPGGPWKDFAMDGQHTIAIKTDGTLWSTGLNLYGQLGLGDKVNRSSFTQIGTKDNWTKVAANSGCSYALNDDGQIWAAGRNTLGACGILDTANYILTLSQETTYGTWFDLFSFTGGFLGLR